MRTILTVLVIALAGLTGCSQTESADAESSPSDMSQTTSPSPSESSTPSPTKGTTNLAQFAGTYSDMEGLWVVYLNADGTFSMDIDADYNARSGTFTVQDEVITLKGKDGQVDEGTIDSEQLSLPFALLIKQ